MAAMAVVGLATAQAHAGHNGHATKEHGASIAEARVRPDPAFDQRLRKFLQKRFLIPEADKVELGPMMRTSIAGIIGRRIRLTNERGQSVKAEVFTNKAGRRIIVGEIFDLDKDPWHHVDLAPLHLADRPTIGPADAAVTIIEFADFECPFCARAFSILETMVHTTYKGKVRVIFKNFPLNSHPWAKQAAVAAECARLQNPGAFWQFAREFYAQQGSITAGNLDSYVSGAAGRLGLDAGLLDACIKGRTAGERVAEDEADGHAVGVESTPTFFINGVKIVGLPNEKSFDFVVKEQIEEARKGAQR